MTGTGSLGVSAGRMDGRKCVGVTRSMELCGLTGYWQDFSSATTEYLPDFSDPGLLRR